MDDHLTRIIVDAEPFSGLSHRNLVLQHHLDELHPSRAGNYGVMASLLLLLPAPGLGLSLDGVRRLCELQLLGLIADLPGGDPPLSLGLFLIVRLLEADVGVVSGIGAVIAVWSGRLVVIVGIGIEVWR